MAGKDHEAGILEIENSKDRKMKKILVTGAAGFIGFHLSRRFLKAGHSVIGVDNLNDYYDVNLKKARLRLLKDNDDFHFIKMDIAEKEEHGLSFQERGARDCRPHGGAGRSQILPGKPPCISGEQSCRFFEYTRRVPASEVRTFGLRLVKLSLWGQYGDAVFRASQCGSSREPLCSHKEGQ